jgi:hypothetical protein
MCCYVWKVVGVNQGSMVVRTGGFGEDGYLGWIMEYICMRILYSKRKCDHIEVKMCIAFSMDSGGARRRVADGAERRVPCKIGR